MAPSHTRARPARLSLLLTALALAAVSAAPTSAAEQTYLCHTAGDTMASFADRLASGTPAETIVSVLFQQGCPWAWIVAAACALAPGHFVWCGDLAPAPPVGGLLDRVPLVPDRVRDPVSWVRDTDVGVDVGLQPGGLLDGPPEGTVSVGVTDYWVRVPTEWAQLVPWNWPCGAGTFFAGWATLAPSGPTVAICVGV